MQTFVARHTKLRILVGHVVFSSQRSIAPSAEKTLGMDSSMVEDDVRCVVADDSTALKANG
jgi:hypothetical protein